MLTGWRVLTCAIASTQGESPGMTDPAVNLPMPRNDVEAEIARIGAMADLLPDPEEATPQPS